MARGSELLGLPVVDAHTGRRLGRVRDLVLGDGAQRVTGLVLDSGGWWRPPRVVPWVAVQGIGSGAAVVQLDSADLAERSGPCWSDLAGKPALTGQGNELGLLADLWLRPDGTVAGFQLSSGLLDDLLSGQSVLPAPRQLRYGADAVFFPDEPESAGGERL